MNIKNNQSATNNQQSSYQNLSAIGLYNKQVENYLLKHPLTELQARTVLTYLKAWKQLNVTTEQYNKKVEEFNNHHGLLIKKKEIKQFYNNQSTDYNYINYAIFDTECMRISMENYLKARKEYNKIVKETNLEINEYNSSKVKSVYKLTPEEKLAKKHFRLKNNNLLTEHYNAAVAFENEYNPIHPKKRRQTIKRGMAKAIFYVCLYFYGAQLRTFNASQLNLNLPTSFLKNKAPKLSISPNDICRFKQNGTRLFDDNQETTIRRHLKRFREAGFIQDYTTTNSLQRAKWRFSRKIIVISEGNQPKKQKSENQALNSEIATTYNDNNKTTRALKKEKEKKDNSTEIGFIKCGSMLESMKTDFAALAYKSTKKDKKGENFAAEKIEKSGFDNELSQSIRTLILDEFVLANLMTKQTFNDNNQYRPIKYSRLQHILQYSNLAPAEIAAFLAQDFIKSNWKLYKNHDVYFVEWKKAINRITKDWFETPILQIIRKYKPNIHDRETLLTTGTCYIAVDEILAYVKKMRTKLEIARKRWLKMSFPISFPYQYYSIYRTESYHLAFYGIEKIYQQQEKNKKIEAIANEKEKRKIRTQKKQKSYEIRLDKKLVEFYTGKINRQQIFAYVQNNLPNSYLKKLSKILISNNTAIA